ncbi:MAG: argininosuccinate lyase [Proteobacteria bacterium]|nr:argininosuccinate lyase [Pseudomonadota bacterium]
MKKLFLTLFLSMMFAGVVVAGDQDFTLINDTGVEIHELYISPAKAGDWGEDVLTVDTLPNGESVEIQFGGKERAAFWDIMVMDQAGDSLEWPHLKLTEISAITLTFVKGEPVAIYE